MRLEVTDVNFEAEKNWIFKLSDGTSDYYILDDSDYKILELSSPITKHELDYLDIGHSLLCQVEEIDGLKIVAKFK